MTEEITNNNSSSLDDSKFNAASAKFISLVYGASKVAKKAASGNKTASKKKASNSSAKLDLVSVQPVETLENPTRR